MGTNVALVPAHTEHANRVLQQLTPRFGCVDLTAIAASPGVRAFESLLVRQTISRWDCYIAEFGSTEPSSGFMSHCRTHLTTPDDTGRQ